MNNKTIKILSLMLLLNVLLTPLVSALSLGSPFQEHMVLQRAAPINVWGTALPGVTVTVKLDNDKVEVVSDANGKWSAVLPEHLAGGPYVFEVLAEDESLRFEDVMVGEVWICSGQSNMFMGYGGIPDIKALEDSTEGIRTFKVKNTVSYEEQDHVGGEWAVSNPGSAVAFSFAYHLQKAADVPVGIILTCWGSSSIEGWMPRDMTSKLPHFGKIMSDFDADEAKKARIDTILAVTGKRKTKDDIFLRTQPNIIYNAMMKGLAPYSCRGLVWYQGEANTKTKEDMIQYGTTLPLWITRIRQEFTNDDMEFLAVMLPSWGYKIKDDTKLNDPTVLSWALIRESQYEMLALPHTGIACTIDLGERKNIHPKDKKPVGQRLALLAQTNTLGMDVVSQGPVMKKVKVKRNSIVISYDNAEGLTTVDDESPSGFWIADASGQWAPADAIIKSDKVVLSSSTITHPLYVRYAFAAMPHVNLINGEDLPAYPFRTDDD